MKRPHTNARLARKSARSGEREATSTKPARPTSSEGVIATSSRREIGKTDGQENHRYREGLERVYGYTRFT